MSKLIGVDYGTERVGVAVSDVRASIAFPRATLPNNRALVPALAALIREESAAAVVIGDSRDARGEENPIMVGARRLADELKRETSAEVCFEPEFYTSAEARKTTGKRTVDAEAAAIILNSYIARAESKNHGLHIA